MDGVRSNVFRTVTTVEVLTPMGCNTNNNWIETKHNKEKNLKAKESGISNQTPHPNNIQLIKLAIEY